MHTTMEEIPADAFTRATQFLQRRHSGIYPAIDPTLTSLSLEGSVVVVTGASEGIGRSVGKKTDLIIFGRSIFKSGC